MIQLRRTVAPLACAILTTSGAHAGWPDEPWTDVRSITSSDITRPGRAVALSGNFLYSSGFDPQTGHGVIGAFRATASGFEQFQTVQDPSPHPTRGFGYPMVAGFERLIIADAGFYTFDHPTFSLSQLSEGPGRVEVFRRLSTNGELVHQQTLADPTGQERSGFGAALAERGNFLLVGAPFASVFGVQNAGAAFLYERRFPQTTYSLVATFTAPTPTLNGYFGYSVALENRTVIVGWPGFANSEGRVAVYEELPGPQAWKLAQIISPRDLDLPQHTNAGLFGATLVASVNASDIIAVGAPTTLYDSAERGMVFVFERDPFFNPDYTMQTFITKPIDNGGILFGRGLSLGAFNADRVLVIGSGDRTAGGGVINIYSSTGAKADWQRDAFIRQVNGGSLATQVSTTRTRVFASANNLSRATLISRDPLCFRDLRADANNDGITDFADLSIVLSSFGQTGDDLPGDLNNDGVVDFIDINFVLFTFGSPCLPPN